MDVGVEKYIYGFEGEQRQIIQHLHEMMVGQYSLKDKLRWKVPFYFQHSWITYINVQKNSAIEFAFVRANELSSAFDILNFKNRKQIAGIEIFKMNDFPKLDIEYIMDEALLLDETIPYKLRKN